MANLVNLGVNVVAYKKNNHLFGMTCAWMTMVDYDKLVMLLGSQSDTAHALKVGDIIGVSALSSAQEEVANHFGDNHSLKVNKFESASYDEKDGAILIKGAKTRLKCRVFDISRVKGNDEDFLVFAEVIESDSDENLKFLQKESLD